MTSRGVVYCDETPYPNLKLPRNWAYHHEPVWGSLQASMQWCFSEYPDASQYGWLADDTRPRTPGWDRQLEAAAGDWGLSYACDLWYSEDPITLAGLEDGRNLSSGLCFGGELVRTVGWWATPGLLQAGIDTAWLEIVRPLGLHRYVPDVTVEHLNWRTGKREFDQGDEWSRGGDAYVERDLVAQREWVRSPAYRQLMRRLESASGRRAAALLYRQSYADELWARRGGLSEAQLQRILKGWDDATIQRSDADPGSA